MSDPTPQFIDYAPLLPTVTSDEEGGHESLEDDLRENVPPHHG
jgi:hypothetical protein